MPTLDFKGKHHIYAHHLTVPYRPLEPDESRSCNPSGEEDNLIIRGDNLHALKALLPRYANRVKCVYIDPPYNTGNEGWIYSDNVNNPPMQEWFKEHNPVDNEDMERHDKWLCMMWPRLHLLKELLAEDGAIFISIDDNEVHRLRMLMDEIFDERNFVADLIWRKKAGGGQDTEYFAREHEHILCYRKSHTFTMQFRKLLRTETEFPKVKNQQKCKFVKLEKWGSNAYREDRPTMFYPIKAPDGTDFYPKAPDGRDGNWRTRPTALDDYHIHWEKRKERWIPYEVIYFHEMKQKNKIVKERTIFYDLATTTDATNEQKEIFGEKVFDNSKPVDLIKRLVLLSASPDSIVLDSFAGSGTTAHAVLALNKEDGGNRKFILVECEDYADTITAKRVRLAIHGVENAKNKTLQEGLGGSFTYCTIGDPTEIEDMLTGKTLPSYPILAAQLLFAATGVSVSDEKLEKKSDDGLFYADNKYAYYLHYEPNLEFLSSDDAILKLEHAERIRDASRRKEKKSIVYAAGNYIGQRELTKMGIVFCQLPYSLYER